MAYIGPEPKVWLVEIGYHDGSAANVLRGSDLGYATEPSDTPANTIYRPWLSIPALYSRSVFLDGVTAGRGRGDAGQIVLINASGAFDPFLDHGLDGREVAIKRVGWLSAYSTADTLFTGTTEYAEFVTRGRPPNTVHQVIIHLRDKQSILENKQAQSTLFEGTTISGGATAEGNADQQGKPKPFGYGRIFNAAPAIANAYDLIYQVNDGPLHSIEGVYIDGVAVLDGATDHADLAALHGATVPASTFHTCKALGLFRLGSVPAGVLTCDFTVGATSADRTAAQIAKSLVLDRGELTAGEIDDAAITALDTATSAECGLYVDRDANTADLLDQVCGSVAAWWGFNRAGKFTMGRLAEPAGAPDLQVTDKDIVELQRGRTRTEGNGVPAYRVRLGYKKNHTEQAIPANAATEERRGEIKERYRFVSSEDASTQTKHLLAPELSFETLVWSEADALAEANHRLDLFKVQRSRWIVSVPLSLIIDAEAIPDIGGIVDVTTARYGMNNGKKFLLVGIQEDYRNSAADLELWG